MSETLNDKLKRLAGEKPETGKLEKGAPGTKVKGVYIKKGGNGGARVGGGHKSSGRAIIQS